MTAASRSARLPWRTASSPVCKPRGFPPSPYLYMGNSLSLSLSFILGVLPLRGATSTVGFRRPFLPIRWPPPHGAASSLRYRPFPTHQDVRQFERLDCSESNSTVRFRSLFLPIRRASGADPSILKTRSRTDCGPTRGTKGWSAAGSSPLSLSRDTPQIGTPY